jgi:hypothetical protein
MRIDESLKIRLDVGMILKATVKPAGRGWILDPWMPDADVIRNDVENNLHASRMQIIR